MELADDLDAGDALTQVAITELFAFGWCTVTAIRLLRLAIAPPLDSLRSSSDKENTTEPDPVSRTPELRR
ncbi:hypothetical protein JL108_18180 [Aeromicrobium sp. YIM 150415]|nr:hypothetical protein [Aeromicrobium sp. YIM 150415]